MWWSLHCNRRPACAAVPLLPITRRLERLTAGTKTTPLHVSVRVNKRHGVNAGRRWSAGSGTGFRVFR